MKTRGWILWCRVVEEPGCYLGHFPVLHNPRTNALLHYTTTYTYTSSTNQPPPTRWWPSSKWPPRRPPWNGPPKELTPKWSWRFEWFLLVKELLAPQWDILKYFKFDEFHFLIWSKKCYISEWQLHDYCFISAQSNCQLQYQCTFQMQVQWERLWKANPTSSEGELNQSTSCVRNLGANQPAFSILEPGKKNLVKILPVLEPGPSY